MFNMPVKLDNILRHIKDFTGVFPENVHLFSVLK